MKALNSIQTMMGRLDRVNTMTRAVSESSMPAVCAITYTGTRAPTAGIILVDSIHSRMSRVFLVGKKAIE